eukprot:GHVT01077405.1.p1 GENE.GHVT01077405.1~~GHVT01077405.1.p1  ORF type:complete len:359 (+),score=76.53 GHVT01077405.1:1140-2216(+)
MLMVVSFIPAYLLDQAYWQRVWVSRSSGSLRGSLFLGTLQVLPTMFAVGVLGMVGASMRIPHTQSISSAVLDASSPSHLHASYFFALLSALPSWCVGLICSLVVCLVASSVDSFQNAIPSLISGELSRRRLSPLWGKLFSAISTAAAVVLALFWNDAVLNLFLVGNLLAAALLPSMLFGMLFSREYGGYVVAFASFFSGVVAVPIVGAIWTGGDPYLSLNWWNLPLGRTDVSATVTFIATPLAAAVAPAISIAVWKSRRRKETAGESPGVEVEANCGGEGGGSNTAKTERSDKRATTKGAAPFVALCANKWRQLFLREGTRPHDGPGDKQNLPPHPQPDGLRKSSNADSLRKETDTHI